MFLEVPVHDWLHSLFSGFCYGDSASWWEYKAQQNLLLHEWEVKREEEKLVSDLISPSRAHLQLPEVLPLNSDS